jgi:DNA ligase (NAD+)
MPRSPSPRAPATLAARAEELRRTIREHDWRYYVLDAPVVSDEAYDALFTELLALEAAHPELRSPDSPTARVGGAPLESLPSARHVAPMLSLDSSLREEDVRRFDARVRQLLAEERPRYVVEPKLDGLSIELVYQGGLLVQAATRGDGIRGEVVTENVRTIRTATLALRADERPVPRLLAVRGEVFLGLRAFERLNAALTEAGQETFANPRNAAAGTLRQLDPRVAAGRGLEIFVYEMMAGEGVALPTHWETLAAFRSWGLRPVPRAELVHGIDEAIAVRNRLVALRDELAYELDGLVIKVDDLRARDEMGATSHHPRWAFAYKFESRKEVTRILKIEVSVGRTGVLTPFAMLLPVDIGGVTISKASLHNREEVARKDIRDRDWVRVERAGDVIPYVVERVEHEGGGRRARRFRMPERCPRCGAAVEERGPFTVCPNRLACPAQLEGRIEHLGSRHALDIAGLGEQTARQLVETGLVRNLADVFALTREQLLALDGFADVSAGNLLAGIDRARTTELGRFLYALSIPDVGRRTAADLAAHFGSLERLLQASEADLLEVEGVGPTMAAAIHGFLAEPETREVIRLMRQRGVRPRGAESRPRGPLSGRTFVFTGALESMGRTDAQSRVEAVGGAAAAAISKRVDVVVAGPGAGSKLAKAQKLGLAIVDEPAFLRILEEAERGGAPALPERPAPPARAARGARRAASPASAGPASRRKD